MRRWWASNIDAGDTLATRFKLWWSLWRHLVTKNYHKAYEINTSDAFFNVNLADMTLVESKSQLVEQAQGLKIKSTVDNQNSAREKLAMLGSHDANWLPKVMPSLSLGRWEAVLVTIYVCAKRFQRSCQHPPPHIIIGPKHQRTSNFCHQHSTLHQKVGTNIPVLATSMLRTCNFGFQVKIGYVLANFEF